MTWQWWGTGCDAAVLREPLSWNQVQVGYGTASGYTIFITSFLGVLVFSRYFQDTTMIMIGNGLLALRALLLAFVKETYMFYIGESGTSWGGRIQDTADALSNGCKQPRCCGLSQLSTRDQVCYLEAQGTQDYAHLSLAVLCYLCCPLKCNQSRVRSSRKSRERWSVVPGVRRGFRP